MHLTLSSSLRPLAFLALLVSPSLAGDGGFATGDLWVRPAVQTGTPFGALVRVDAQSGDASVVLPFTNWQGNAEVYQTFCYDPFRDRILVYGTLTTLPFLIQKTLVWKVDAKGNYTESPFGGIALAPAVDGKLYAALNFSPVLVYYDTSDVYHPLLNAAGTGPFQPFTLGFAPVFASIIYDAPTHSLLYAVGNGGTQCSPATGMGMSALYRLSLSLDGTRVLSSSCTTFDIDGALPGAAGGYPMGFSRRTDGSYVLVVRGVGPSGAPDSVADRMLLVDPTSLVVSTYATNGPYPQASFTNAGTFSRVRNQAVIFDPFGNQLRAYSLGGSGLGTPLAVGAIGDSLDPFGSPIDVERAGMLEIGPLVPEGNLTGTPTRVSLATGGSQTLSLDFGPAFGGSIYLVLGSTHGAVPGLPLSGGLLPLAVDAYFLSTLQHPNSPPLSGSFGTLNAAGKQTCTVTIPSGLSPSLAGVIAHHAALVLTPALTVADVSDAVSLRLVP